MNSNNSRVAHKPDEVDRNDETARTAAIKASPAYRLAFEDWIFCMTQICGQ